MDEETQEACLIPVEANTLEGIDAYRLCDGVKVWVRQFTAPWCRNCERYAQELADNLKDVDPASVLWTQSDVTASEEIQESYAVDKLPRFDVVYENSTQTFAVLVGIPMSTRPSKRPNPTPRNSPIKYGEG